MKRAVGAVLSAVLLVPSLAACGGNALCEVPDVDTSDAAAVREALDGLVDDAPEEVRDDLEVMVEQLELAESDPASIDVEAMTTASENLTRWEAENC
jgi:predicted small lipoprotein YifL